MKNWTGWMAAAIVGCACVAWAEDKAPAAPAAPAATEISAADAAQHIGKTATVCGLVADAKFMDRPGHALTFLNFDKPFPNHTFTVIIKGEDRAKFPEPPEKAYKGKTICVTGQITEKNKKPQIQVTDASQITVKDAPAAAPAAPAPQK